MQCINGKWFEFVVSFLFYFLAAATYKYIAESRSLLEEKRNVSWFIFLCCYQIKNPEQSCLK